MVKFIDGDMFEHEHDCYVNTINCVGVMGAGIALEFKNKYPEMYTEYRRLCNEGEIAVGDCWVYKKGDIYLANLAVKNNFRHRIRFPWAKISIRNLINSITDGRLPVHSVALPRIGSKNGGRGAEFTQWGDYWPADSEAGYKELLQPFLLAELKKCPKVEFTVYHK